MSGSTTRPFLQGELDGLCGIYAIINAIRLAMGPRAGQLAAEHWHDLFAELMAAADDLVGAMQATVSGIEVRPFRKVLKRAARHMRDEHGIEILADRLIPPGARPTIGEVLEALKAELTQPGHAAIVSFGGFLDHWTVVRTYRSGMLELFDSCTLCRVSTANCRMSYEPPMPGRRQHIIRPGDAFILQAI